MTKDASAFRVHKRGHRMGRCRQCENAYQRSRERRYPDEYRRRKRESMARRRAADPEAARAYQREFRLKNLERCRARMRTYLRARFFYGRAMKLRGPGKATTREVAGLWKAQRGRCALTGRKMDRTAQLDHILPKARGGGDEVSNLRWVCVQANLAKRELTDREFVALCSDVMRWIGSRIQIIEDFDKEVRCGHSDG